MKTATLTPPLRWGTLSTGCTAHDVADDLSLINEGEVVGVGSRSRASAHRFADELGIAHRRDSYEALVGEPAVDAVCAATPHPMHLDNALLAIGHDTPVLVEKSFAMNGDRAANSWRPHV
ncbi:MAG TPA: Gfo/Idh/MocA family oxidoreductase [Acidimicrobiales bacterium]|nr:Gfo/Idh/MocA family oxidoreductase [Acidimicrobiales bacterium]